MSFMMTSNNPKTMKDRDWGRREAAGQLTLSRGGVVDDAGKELYTVDEHTQMVGDLMLL